MFWADTGSTPPSLKQRNAANSGWTNHGPLADLGIQSGAQVVATVAGTVDAITLAFSPAITAFDAGPKWWRAAGANTVTTPTVKRDGLAAKTLVKGNNLALAAADIPGAGAWMCSVYDAGNDREVLLNPAKGVGAAAQKIINVVEATPVTSYSSAADAGIFDDTIPQLSEGTALMSVSITPTSATSRLRVEFLGDFGVSSGGNHVVVAMYRDSTANAVNAGAVTIALNTNMIPLALAYEAVAGSTAATTFSIRFSGSGTLAYVNGSGVARRLGGAMAATLRVTEIAA